MPIVSAFIVNGFFLSVLLYYNDFKILENFTGSLNLLSLFVGVYYAITSAFSGGVVRAWAGISLVGLAVIDLGVDEAVTSALQAIVGT
jgi:hypothetical protein